jgi:hypothetical protein
VLAVGDGLPDVSVFTLDRQRVALAALIEEGPALLFFYLFDFSST